MTAEEAVAIVDGMFRICRTIGKATEYKDSDDKSRGAAPPDRSLAPCGEPYVTVSCFGVDADLPADAVAMFSRESQAVRWWLDEVEAYAETVAPREKWPELWLYWKTEPTWHETTFIAMNQAELLQTASPLSRLMTLGLGFVQAELAISLLDPDGKEP